MILDVICSNLQSDWNTTNILQLTKSLLCASSFWFKFASHFSPVKSSAQIELKCAIFQTHRTNLNGCFATFNEQRKNGLSLFALLMNLLKERDEIIKWLFLDYLTFLCFWIDMHTRQNLFLASMCAKRHCLWIELPLCEQFFLFNTHQI